MKVIIRETDEIKTLSFIDPASGINRAADLIGNTGGLTDGQFVRDDSSGTYICSQETFDWWSALIEANEALSYRMSNLATKHGSDAVLKVVLEASGYDLEEHAEKVNQALDEAFGTVKL